MFINKSTLTSKLISIVLCLLINTIVGSIVIYSIINYYIANINSIPIRKRLDFKNGFSTTLFWVFLNLLVIISLYFIIIKIGYKIFSSFFLRSLLGIVLSLIIIITPQIFTFGFSITNVAGVTDVIIISLLSAFIPYLNNFIFSLLKKRQTKEKQEY